RFRFFRLFRLKWPLALLLLALLLAGLGWLASRTLTWAAVKDWLAQPVPLGVLLAIFATLRLLFVPPLISLERVPSWLPPPVQMVGRFLIRSSVAPFVSAAAAVQLYVLDPLYQHAGQLSRLGKPPREVDGAGKKVGSPEHSVPSAG